MAVVRGVNMFGSFHGAGNASGEMFAGVNDATMPHVASSIAAVLKQKYGPKLLDNLVFENATYTFPSGGAGTAPVYLNAESLGSLAGGLATSPAGVPAVTKDERFLHAKKLAAAIGESSGVGEVHREVFKSYIDSMNNAEQMRSILRSLTSKLRAQDASLDLNLQLDTALTLMQAGLSRVVTLCVGASNGRNKVDGFGMFDCHQGLYHAGTNGLTNTTLNYQKIEGIMANLNALMKRLKTTKYKNTNKSWFDVTTVVLSSEFARPGNLSGNESGGNSAFGCGHQPTNNNYLLFGRKIRGGSWIGHTNPLTQVGSGVDVATIESADPTALVYRQVGTTGMTAPQPGSPAPSALPGMPAPGTAPAQPAGPSRPLRAFDMVRTLMETVDGASAYKQVYSSPKMADAKVLRSIIKS